MSNPKHLVFVYGTLLHGFGNYESYLKKSRFIVDARVKGCLLPVSSFPGYIPNSDDENDIVHGEVYYVDDETLEALDMLEGYNPDNILGSMYVRDLVRPIGFDRDVYIYIWNEKDALYKYSKIENGDYRQWYYNRMS